MAGPTPKTSLRSGKGEGGEVSPGPHEDLINRHFRWSLHEGSQPPRPPQPHDFQGSFKAMPGHIYALKAADGIIKVGRTAQEYGPSLRRLRAYPGDSVLLYVRISECEDLMESKILKRLRELYGDHPRGLEWFSAPEDEVIRVIESVFELWTEVKELLKEVTYGVDMAFAREMFRRRELSKL